MRGALLAVGVVVTGLLAWAPTPVAASTCPPEGVEAPDPIALYGPDYRLAVYRDGARICTHDFRFRRDGDALAAGIVEHALQAWRLDTADLAEQGFEQRDFTALQHLDDDLGGDRCLFGKT